jgi:hypothetical protein
MKNRSEYGKQDYTVFNLSCLQQVAEKMGPLREKVVFLGGTVLPLLTTRPTGLCIRKSKDVDLLADFETKDEIYAFEDALWERGFKKRSTGAVCRWILEEIRIDVLPADPEVVGFNNQWCREAMSAFLRVDLGRGLGVKITAAPWFLAAKFNAFYRRGEGDYNGSYDIYDMLVLIAGRPGMDQEILASAGPALRGFLARELEKVWQNTNGLRNFSLNIGVESSNQVKLFDLISDRMKRIISMH